MVKQRQPEQVVIYQMKIKLTDKAIFEWEVWSWYTDEAVWPGKLTTSVFRKWFDVEIYEMVIDLLDKHVMREEL